MVDQDFAHQDIRLASGARITSVVLPHETDGAFSVYRWEMVNATVEPHYHTKFGESFYVEKGEIEFYDGSAWRNLTPGTFIHLPVGRVHAVRRSPNTVTGEATVLMFFTPAVPRHEYFNAITAADSGEMAQIHLDHDNNFVDIDT